MAFAPTLWIDPNDADPSRETYYAVRKTFYGYTNALDIIYLLGYHWDGGVEINGDTYTEHLGDSEFIQLTVQYQPNAKRWYLLEAVCSSHWGTVNNNTNQYIYDQLQYRRSDGSIDHGNLRRNPIAYVARSKHGSYNSESTCAAAEEFTNCWNTQYSGRVYVNVSRNIGSYSHRFKDCVKSVQPDLNRGEECFWDSSVDDFRGWQTVGGDGAGPYWKVLQAFHWRS